MRIEIICRTDDGKRQTSYGQTIDDITLCAIRNQSDYVRYTRDRVFDMLQAALDRALEPG